MVQSHNVESLLAIEIVLIEAYTYIEMVDYYNVPEDYLLLSFISLTVLNKSCI